MSDGRRWRAENVGGRNNHTETRNDGLRPSLSLHRLSRYSSLQTIPEIILFFDGKFKTLLHTGTNKAKLGFKLVHIGPLGVTLALPRKACWLLCDVLPHLALQMLARNLRITGE